MLVGIDIGGTKCAVCIGEFKEDKMTIKDKRVIPTDHSISPYEMIDKICLLIDELTEAVDVIGISCGGPLDSKRGIIQSPPNLPNWADIKIVDYLEDKYKCKVYLQNDANACAVAEWKYGAGQGCENMIFLTFGTGLGAGLILNGNLYTGTSDMAGECGHIRLSSFGPVGYGKAGSFEGFCSGSGIAQLGQMMAKEQLQMGKQVSYCTDVNQLDTITAKKIAEYANEGHADAQVVFEVCGEMLGRGLAVLIDILNPECIVLGSVFQRSEHLLRESMEREIRKECLDAASSVCRIVPASLQENIGDYAALAVAMIGGR